MLVNPTTGQIIDPVDLSDDDLLDEYQSALERRDIAIKEAGLIEQELRFRISGREAIGIPSDHYICEIKTENKYTQVLFTPLKELFNATDLKACLEPEHWDKVLDRWHTQKTLAAAKRYGKEAMDIVYRAREPGRETLVFKKREA